MVTAVLCAAFDEASDAAILRVRERLRALGHALPDRPPHRPHLTFAAARVERGGELDRVVAVAAQVAARHAPLPLVLSHVGRFGRAGALWLGPDPSPALAALQADAHESLLAAGWPAAFGERSDAGQWAPHCTLATRVPKPRLRDLQDALADGYEPIHALVDAVATILVGGRGDTALAPLTG
ncbi:MAG: 2'-5' RNA ligase family protein [Jatrophihabitans sp.]|uniref:2'-5' RNA ligase family protein n=1 Tax=Jatrophihabitans sp. TaxID=1932789 RepID=UPI003F7F65EE